MTALSALRSKEHAPWLVLLAGLCALYVPMLVGLFNGVWADDTQGHGPIILALACWLIYKRWDQVHATGGSGPMPLLAWPLLAVSGLMYALGRSQGILLFEVGSLIPMLLGCVLLVRGPQQARAIWFPLFFMVFMIPLPALLVDAMTAPMKMAVSYVAEQILYAVGYPIARTGVILQVGPYQMLVADACAGLHTLFTLEALGLFYLNLVQSASLFRNVTLAVLIIPISFFANVIRVMVLVLITYHFGDEAGQGFLHDFAGLVLFLSALLLILTVDGAVHWVDKRLSRRREARA
ncbi:MAG: exosortase B [Ideonella sp.]|nr:exosortase B [Ideonella sp.]